MYLKAEIDKSTWEKQKHRQNPLNLAEDQTLQAVFRIPQVW